ncbi:MAG: hypothetical protein C5B54_04185, partial [Acidobacteria bacterium]
LEYIQQERKLLQDLTTNLKVSRDELLERVHDIMDRNKKLEKEVERMKTQAMVGSTTRDVTQEIALQNGKLGLVGVFEADADQIGRFVDEKGKEGGPYSVVIGVDITSGATAIRSAADEYNAAQLLKTVLVPEFDGGGGGRKDFAKGGLKKVKDFSVQDLLARIKALFERS